MNALIYEHVARERDREAHSQACRARLVRLVRGARHKNLARRAVPASPPLRIPTTV